MKLKQVLKLALLTLLACGLMVIGLLLDKWVDGTGFGSFSLASDLIIVVLCLIYIKKRGLHPLKSAASKAEKRHLIFSFMIVAAMMLIDEIGIFVPTFDLFQFSKRLTHIVLLALWEELLFRVIACDVMRLSANKVEWGKIAVIAILCTLSYVPEIIELPIVEWLDVLLEGACMSLFFLSAFLIEGGITLSFLFHVAIDILDVAFFVVCQDAFIQGPLQKVFIMGAPLVALGYSIVHFVVVSRRNASK